MTCLESKLKAAVHSLFIYLIVSLFLTSLSGQLTAQSNDGPLSVKTYKLSNGLTVYLNEDNSKPEVFGAVVVRAGSRNDPEDATGVAHYFEHMMFKGTDRIGTKDWEKESILLDSISDQYDRLAEMVDPEERKNTLMNINRLSLLAAEYAIPNETDVILRDIGSNNLNAGTSFDMTTYYNTFPAFQIEKWIEIYADRFRNPVFRLFQSELEVVYEEKNLYSDVPVQGMLEDFLGTHYKGHPYSRPIIGLTEHLKNPRISKMMDFFKTWYVANNMALVLIGDFKAEDVMPVIEAKFGQLPAGNLPSMDDHTLQPFKGREFRQTRMSPIRIGLAGFRSVPYGHEDSPVFYLAGRLLSNGSGTGIFDKMMVENKVMAIQPISFQSYDHGSYIILFVPKIVGQSFSKAESLVNLGLDRLKKGDFTAELLDAVKLEVRKEYLRNLESMNGRYGIIMQAFITGRSWQEMLDEIHQIESVTKEDIMRVSNQYFGENRLVYYSKMGMPPKDKLPKPDWKPVAPRNTEEKSDFAKTIDAMSANKISPRFVQFGKDVQFGQILDGYTLYQNHNPYNDIFTMSLRFNKGILHDPKLGLASSYLNLVGTEEKSFEAFKSTLQNLGATVDFSASDNQFSVNIEGLDNKLGEILSLVNEILTRPGMEEKQMKRMVDDMKASVKMQKQDPMGIAAALSEYVMYGDQSSYVRSLTVKEAKALKAPDMIAAFRDALTYSGNIIYTGQKDFREVSEILRERISWSNQPVASEFVVLDRKQYSEPMVFLHDNKKARQGNIHFFVEGNTIQNENEYADMTAFNDYFGSGMSSIVFQEIREFRSLAYTAYAVFNRPQLKGKPGYLNGYLNTQSDKTIEGIEALSQLILDMPEKPERMDGIRKGLTLNSFTSFPDFRNIGSRVANWRRLGYEQDPGELYEKYFSQIRFENIVDFYKKQVHGKPLIISVSGQMKKIDTGKLEKLGKIRFLKYNQFIKE